MISLPSIFLRVKSLIVKGFGLKKIILGSDIVPVIGQGTYGFGGYFEAAYEGDEAIIKSMKLGFSLGMTLVDTAEVYGRGRSEEIVGKAIENVDRSKFYIATKVWKSRLHYDDVLSSCCKSLERLRTRYVDLYQVHWPNPSIPIEETMRAFEKLVDDGLIHNIGVSNFSVSQLRSAQDALKKYRIVSNQVPYSLGRRDIEETILPYCKENNITIIAYSPLEEGNLPRGSKSDALHAVANKYHRTPAQIALNWLVSKGVIVIPKAAKQQHVIENAQASDFELDSVDISTLEKA